MICILCIFTELVKLLLILTNLFFIIWMLSQLLFLMLSWDCNVQNLKRLLLTIRISAAIATRGCAAAIVAVSSSHEVTRKRFPLSFSFSLLPFLLSPDPSFFMLLLQSRIAPHPFNATTINITLHVQVARPKIRGPTPQEQLW